MPFAEHRYTHLDRVGFDKMGKRHITPAAKKISGMLCEAVKSPDETGIIAGIGVNFVVDKTLVPPELRKKIGALTDVSKKKLSKEQLCAAYFKRA